jgi:hypothetical protein
MVVELELVGIRDLHLGVDPGLFLPRIFLVQQIDSRFIHLEHVGYPPIGQAADLQIQFTVFSLKRVKFLLRLQVTFNALCPKENPLLNFK